MTFPDTIIYTKDHEWLQIAGDIGVIGITDFAQSELGDIVFIEMPAKGKQISRGEIFGTVEAVKTVSDLYSPISGEVTEVNTELADSPQIINNDPYDRGWIIKMKIKDPAELSGLLDVKKYRAMIGK